MDYIPRSVELVLTNAIREVCLDVVTLDDNIVEFGEVFEVLLGSADIAVVIGRLQSTGFIVDNDSKCKE